MEASPSILDYMKFDEHSPYRSPDQEADDGGLYFGQFDSFNAKQDFGDHQTPADLGGAFSKADMWDNFTHQYEPLGTADQKPYFADPEMCSPESDNVDIQGQIQVVPMNMSQPSTRRSSTKSLSHRTSKSGSMSTDITPPEQEPPKKRKARKVRKESNTAENDQKRSKFLERNRIAASKCREKKKQYVSELEEAKIELETKHAHLQIEVNELMSTVGLLKDQLMAHAKCNDPNIDQWIHNEARRFVQTDAGGNELFPQPFLPFGQVPPPDLSTDSSHSRNTSAASTQPYFRSIQYDGLATDDRRPSIQYDGLTTDDRRPSIAYSHSELNPPSRTETEPNLQC
jgi:cyclic AMP-dependent transcription factor ATF-2